MPNSIIVDLTVISQSYPTLEEPTVYREGVIDTIERILKDSIDLVLIEGDENIGKTTTLAQFAKKNNSNCISYFIKPTSRWSYRPDFILIDICNQIQWILNKDKELISSDINLKFFQGLMYDLHKHATKSDRKSVV